MLDKKFDKEGSFFLNKIDKNGNNEKRNQKERND